MATLYLPHPERIRVRQIRDPKQLEPLLALEQQAYSFPWSEQVFIDCLNSGYDLLSYHSREGLVGYSVWMPVVDELHLLNLCIAPNWQGQGVGRSALEFAKQGMPARHLRSILLEVRASNLPALKLYTRAGFVEIGRRRGYYPASANSTGEIPASAQREDAIVMRYTAP
ncbi:MAG TPA: ribosomal-protein-alanine N-acetyltransferase [Halothiobacillus sp.]|nr:ribosomal-protein-alanine N-acetyltransferase [Halothiobacillus sp.]